MLYCYILAYITTVSSKILQQFFSCLFFLTSQLWVSDTAPLPAPVAQACALHHVTQDFVAFVPLVAHTVHRSIVGGAQLLMGYVKNKMEKNTSKTKKKCFALCACSVCVLMSVFIHILLCVLRQGIVLGPVSCVTTMYVIKCCDITVLIESLFSHGHKP